MKLVYVTKARLPTESANGVQISKMCEAFANAGLTLTLLHCRQPTERLRAKSVFEFYGVPPSFTVRALGNLDVIAWERWVPKSLLMGVWVLHGLIWGRYAAQVARREKADLYFTRDLDVGYWLTRFGLPTVFEAHQIPKRLLRSVARRLGRRSTLLMTVAVTSFEKEEFRRLGFADERILVRPNGIDLSHFEKLPSRQECRRRLGLPAEHRIAGYIGRFETLGAGKGIRELVQAMALPALANDDRLLLLCVGGPMDAVPAYREQIARLGIPPERVRFLDRVPYADVPAWIRACDVVTLPWPWTEHLAYHASPLKLFEYMAAETPIVASDVPAVREILRDGENARLVEPGDARALARGVQELAGGGAGAAALAARARRDVLGHTWAIRAATILDSVKNARPPSCAALPVS